MILLILGTRSFARRKISPRNIVPQKITSQKIASRKKDFPFPGTTFMTFR